MARDLTGDEKAANGPLPGGLSVAGAEHRGSASIASLGCYPLLDGAEISGADRSGDGQQRARLRLASLSRAPSSTGSKPAATVPANTAHPGCWPRSRMRTQHLGSSRTRHPSRLSGPAGGPRESDAGAKGAAQIRSPENHRS